MHDDVCCKLYCRCKLCYFNIYPIIKQSSCKMENFRTVSNHAPQYFPLKMQRRIRHLPKKVIVAQCAKLWMQITFKIFLKVSLLFFCHLLFNYLNAEPTYLKMFRLNFFLKNFAYSLKTIIVLNYTRLIQKRCDAT